MRIFKLMLLSSLILPAITSCTNNQAEILDTTINTTSTASTADEVRIILINSDTQCQLRIQKGRDDPELITPKSCSLEISAAGNISAVKVQFDAPCKQYTFNNIIGEMYFIDDKSIATHNKACRVESFNSSYGWAIERKQG